MTCVFELEKRVCLRKKFCEDKLTRKVFLPVISNFFGKNTVNRVHFELIPGKNSDAK